MPVKPFTRENAAENARKATQSRLARQAREREAEQTERELRARLPIDGTEDAKKLRVQKQIETCDRMLDQCSNPELFVKLTMAKERLWNLIYPKPGSLRPKQSRQERAPVVPLQPISEPIQPQPVVNQAPLVVPEIEQSHKSEIVQS